MILVPCLLLLAQTAEVDPHAKLNPLYRMLVYEGLSISKGVRPMLPAAAIPQGNATAQSKAFQRLLGAEHTFESFTAKSLRRRGYVAFGKSRGRG